MRNITIKLYYKAKLLFDGGEDFAIDGDGEILLLDPTTGNYGFPVDKEDYNIEVNFSY